eukprot:TRINITY_DN27_c0_g1_i2.p1 TRINITY_DN27_c0_g1~~TRINITY_DN27_c0_g1_i2.p1  ORF type:complete len:484 (+),score=113.87 TRINITY_DN27_c0_g1_i2:26-1453(+)
MATTFRGAPPTLSLSPPTASDQRLVMALAARFSTAASSLVFHASCEKIPTVLSSAASTTASTATQFTTSVQRNANIAKLQAGYLFPEIKRRRDAHLQKNPDANIISLGIGDTTEPIPLVISEAMAEKARALATLDGYSGYGAEQGDQALREAVANVLYAGTGRTPSEIFVSDGAKCDISRLQLLFGPAVSMACQDPSYPAYVDTSVMMGQTGTFVPALQQYSNISYLRCDAANGFFPDLEGSTRTDIVFFCSPNNPTGQAATRKQLEELVEFARKNGSIIVYDSAYAIYISDPNCPKSIYEIPGAEEVAIETGSFSKYVGFTGVRLGWTVVPSALRFSDGSSVSSDFNRVMTTCFNGASNVAQAGGLACLTPEGLKAMADLVEFYKENARILKDTFESLGYKALGGENAPYVWVEFPGKSSWDVFEEILTQANVVTTPGSGFGPGGEGFVRASAFGHRKNILEASQRLKELLGKR